MSGKYISVNNWWKYQHYKERRPVWVKLHVTYLEDKKDWPADQRLIALLLMIVAANKDNRFTDSPHWLAEELGLPVSSVRRSVAALLEDGFLRPADAPDTEQPKGANADDPASNSSISEESDAECVEAMPTRVSSPLLALTEDQGGIVKGGGRKGGRSVSGERKPRQPDACWDAVDAIWPLGADASGSELNRRRAEVKRFRECLSLTGLPEPEWEEEIRRRARLLWTKWGGTDEAKKMVNPGSLSSRWSEVEMQPTFLVDEPLPERYRDWPAGLQAVCREFRGVLPEVPLVGWSRRLEDGELDVGWFRSELEGRRAA